MNYEYDPSTPSNIIRAFAQGIHAVGIDPYFNGGNPTEGEYIVAILQYLDEQYNKLK